MLVDPCYGCEKGFPDCLAEVIIDALSSPTADPRVLFVSMIADDVLGNARHTVLLQAIVELRFPQHLIVLENVLILR